MFRAKVIVFIITISAGTAALAQSAAAPDLPPGALQSKARSGCTICHDSHIIVQQRLSKAAWGKEVDKMTKWGAVVSPADRDALVNYFSDNFSPDKPPYIPRRLPAARH